MPEYTKFKEMEFEIQVRTILQHTWAAIEHDRDFKFRGQLPENLQRRFKIVAGALEVCEEHFERIAEEIKEYTKETSYQIKHGKLEGIPINSYSLRLYLIEKFGDIPAFKSQYGLLWAKETFDELECLDIKTLQDLDKIIPAEFKEKYVNIQPPKHGTYLSRLVRHILTIYKTDDYFSRAWRGHYYELDSQDHLVFTEFKVNMELIPDEIHFDCSNL